MHTLRGRLLFGTTVGTGCVLAGAAVALYVMVESSLLTQFDETLEAKARSLASAVEQDGGALELEFNATSLPEFGQSDASEYFQIWSADGQVVARSPSLGDNDLLRIAPEVDTTTVKHVALPDGRAGRCIGFSFVPRQERLWYELGLQAPIEATVVVARGTAKIQATIARLKWVLVVGCGGAILVAVVVLLGCVTAGLAPLRTIAAEIGAIGETSLSSRLDPDKAPGELVPVVSRLNELLQRLDRAFSHEKAITADMAHELRTPLAGLRTTLEVSLSKNRTDVAYREAMTKLLAGCVQMQRMIETLLELARADAGQLDVTLESVDLVDALRVCWCSFEKQAQDRRLTLTWDVPQACEVATDPTKLQLILNNLLDNAVTYADEGGSISVSVEPDVHVVRFRIANTGNHLPASDTQHVFERFWRGDTARASSNGLRRCGLGLPLCQRLVLLLGGTIEASTNDDGSFTVSFTLPR